MKFFFRCFLLSILFFFLIECSTVDEENKPIIINDISILKMENKAPRESDFQVDIELKANMSSDNLDQEIDYKWIVEDLKMDIILTKNTGLFDRTSDLVMINYKEGVFFLDVSNNPLVSMLSLYKPGYYRITLIASNINETKYKSTVIKVGNPLNMDLYFKFNIPSLVNNKDNTVDFKGKFYYTWFNGTKRNSIDSDIFYEVNAKDMSSDWYNTGIRINPFLSFGIDTGAYIVDDKKPYLASLEKTRSVESDCLKYDFKDEKGKIINNSPVILNKMSSNTVFSIYKSGSASWLKGDVFLSYLIWGYDKDKDCFSTFESKINAENINVTNYFENKYLVKILIGPVGLKTRGSDYFVFFGTEGINLDELDLQKKRDFTGLPYGYLLGKLGKDGTPFPIGASYYYSSSLFKDIYSLNKFDTFVINGDTSSDN